MIGADRQRLEFQFSQPTQPLVTTDDPLIRCVKKTDGNLSKHRGIVKLGRPFCAIFRTPEPGWKALSDRFDPQN
jgi:hypothetical protein